MTRKARSLVRILCFERGLLNTILRERALPGLKNAPVFIANFSQCPDSGLIIFSRYITSLRGHVNSVYQVNINNTNRAKQSKNLNKMEG